MFTESTQTVWLAYLGRRGGGAHLLNQTERILTNSGISTLSIVSNEKNSSINQNKVLRTPSLGMTSFFRVITFPFISFKLFFNSRKHLPATIIQIMPSPMDFWFDIWGFLFKVEIFRVIHDFEPHPGENWPTKRAIQRRLYFAGKIFVFSSYVGRNLVNSSNKAIYACTLPDEISQEGVVSDELRMAMKRLERPIILSIGRVRKYKGLEFLISTLEKAPKFSCTFLIAGDGPINIGENSNVFLWNRWLTEAEIEFLLSEAEIVIFPYLEASQSGVIPLAMKKNKIILATKVGSLEEQLKGYENKVLIDSADVASLVNGIETSVRMTRVPQTPGKKCEADESLALGNQVIKVLSKGTMGEKWMH